jgi:cell division protein FtsI/penicillin-binding protein 2
VNYAGLFLALELPLLIPYYASAFDPLKTSPILQAHFSGSVLLEPTPADGTPARVTPPDLPQIGDVRRQFARSIEERISEKRVTFVPLLYGADKEQRKKVQDLGIQGIFVSTDHLVYANPELIKQSSVSSIARQLSPILVLDQDFLRNQLRQRPLRYVPIMGRLPSELSLKVKELKVQSAHETDKLRAAEYARTGRRSESIEDPFRGIALLPEHWRFYPDTTIASHVVGFVNALKEPQYGIERTFDAQLRGQEGLLATVSDPFGGQIASAQQKLVDPRDGSTIVLTIDRFVQKKVEELLDEKVHTVDAASAQAIVMDPKTGRIIAMANAPLFDSNIYGSVYAKEPILLTPDQEQKIVVEIFHPVTNALVVRAYLPDIKTPGRPSMSPETRQALTDIEKLYDLNEVSRYYLYIGEHNRREIFPTDKPGVWLKYSNNIGVGSYLNRNIQEIYEPGSVMKSITLAIAIDQGEVLPTDIYDDKGPVRIDEYTIKNALNKYYGKVSLIDCIGFSINTCMTSVSKKLGRKLFYNELRRFGFGAITGIELDNELPGDLKPWRNWSDALLATAAYGQGVSATPLQMITAFAALANGGKLMHPTIIDEVRNSDGTVDVTQPHVIDQVIKPETAATMTAILVHSAATGYAKPGKVPGYRIAGKTGTSQIAGPGGRYEEGTGSTTATYAGFAPVDDPKFVILVKFDRPKKEVYGSLSAAPVFKDIAKFLFEYYGIPPDEK